MYAVFDANNFYVSCERVVNPKLQNVPVVVANRGGVILARSNEVKAMKIPMAAPLFKVEEQLKANNVQIISTNFSLYTDLSKRIASILHGRFPFIEEYSIDESFAYFTDNTAIEDIESECAKARTLILQWTGVPVSVGIGKTKTLAKVAVKLAKKIPSGLMSIVSDTFRIEVLEKFPIGDIWGVGWALTKKLPAYGINTALDLAKQDVTSFRKKFSVILAYTINELNGIPCFTVETAPKPAKSLMCTESYTQAITDKEGLEARLVALATRAGVQLRKQKEFAGGMGVFTRGDRFHKEKGYLALQEDTTFMSPTDYTPDLTGFVRESLDKLFFEGAKIKRAGVYLFDLMPKEHRQYGLFEIGETMKSDKNNKAMVAIDAIAKKWGDKGKKRGIFMEITI